MHLSNAQVSFLIKYRDRLLERKWMLELLTEVRVRPIIVIPQLIISDFDLIPTDVIHPDGDLVILAYRGKKLNRWFGYYDAPAKGYRPLRATPALDVPAYEAIPPESTPAGQWCRQTGLTLITPHPQTDQQFVSNWIDWQLMSHTQQIDSDSKCRELFHASNRQMYIRQLVLHPKLKPEYLPSIGSPLDIDDTFNLKTGDLPNLKEDIVTTVGLFFTNWYVFESNIPSRVDYLNEQWSPKTIETRLKKLLMTDKITVPEFETVVDSVFGIGSLAEVFSPTLTEKSLTTHPDVPKRKKELLLEHAHELSNPLIAKKIEDELITLDKKHMEGDLALNFITPLGSKTWDVHRKKMFLTVGGIEAFEDGSGLYDFIPNSLCDGWTVEMFATLCNEIRKGAYSRGKETAKGGEQTKFILRIFQDLIMGGTDCHASDGYPLLLTDAIGYLGRQVMQGDKTIELTEDNITAYLNKEVTLRAPHHCKSPSGICKVCAGSIMEKLNVKALGMQLIAVSSKFTTAQMKNMHGTTIQVIEVDPLDFFVAM